MDSFQQIRDLEPIIGSAEPLTPQQTRERLRELAEWGVDLSLVQASLERTPTERIERLEAALELVQALQAGYAAREAQLAKPQEKLQ
jgi:hypothetical protein